MPTPNQKIAIAAIIPARYSSSRFPGKPLAVICGKPMIRHVYERASCSRLISGVWVATDDQRIYEAVEAFGGQAIFTRPNHTCGTERLAEANQKISAEVVINIQGDEPLISPQAIDLLAESMLADPNLLMATLKRRIFNRQQIDNPNCVKVVTDKHGFALYFSRATIPLTRDDDHYLTPYYQHVGIYAYRGDFLQKITLLPPSSLEQIEKLEQLRVLENGYKIKVIETDYESYGVDTPHDLAIIEAKLQQNI